MVQYPVKVEVTCCRHGIDKISGIEYQAVLTPFFLRILVGVEDFAAVLIDHLQFIDTDIIPEWSDIIPVIKSGGIRRIGGAAGFQVGGELGIGIDKYNGSCMKRRILQKKSCRVYNQLSKS